MPGRHVVASRVEPTDVLQCASALAFGHGKLRIDGLPHDLCDRGVSCRSYLAELLKLLGCELTWMRSMTSR